MTKLDDGGPAFPIPQQQFTDGVTIVSAQGHDGMSLRDWFAGQALTGLLTRGPGVEMSSRCQQAYNYADAMIDFRKKGPSDDNR